MFRTPVDDDTELRLLEERHADELFECVERNRAHLRRWLPWLDDNTRVEHTRAFLRACLQQFSAGNGFTCGLWHQGRLAGVIGLHYVDWDNRRTSVGYWLDEAHQGRGLMTRACAAVVDHVLGDLGLNRVEIDCAAGNARSRAIPERLGFTREGELRQREWLYDHFVDHVLYGLMAAEWQARRSGRRP